MTYIFYTVALLLIAFPGYWSEKGDGKYCLKSPEINSPDINHISHISHQNLLHLFSTSIISSLSFGSFGLIRFPYTLQTFLESCDMKLPFSYLGTLINIGWVFFFFCYQCFLLLFFLYRLISSWEGFLEVCSQTELCWESRSYCLVSVHNKQILVALLG